MVLFFLVSSTPSTVFSTCSVLNNILLTKKLTANHVEFTSWVQFAQKEPEERIPEVLTTCRVLALISRLLLLTWSLV